MADRISRETHPRVRSPQFGPTRTKQSMMEDVDINLIVKRYAQTGVWDHLETRQPHYGDFSQSVTLAEAFALVNDAQESFMGLPAEVRREALNDPVRMLEMLSDQEQAQKLVDAGLPVEGLEKTPESKPAEPARVASPSEPSEAPE